MQQKTKGVGVLKKVVISIRSRIQSDAGIAQESLVLKFQTMMADRSCWKKNLQAAWDFHTASTESIIGGMLHMREDALIRLGDDGIGCNVTSSEDNYGFQFHGGRRIDSLSNDNLIKTKKSWSIYLRFN